jgi:hypothetical protein
MQPYLRAPYAPSWPIQKMSLLRGQVRVMYVNEVLEAVTSYLIQLANYPSGFIKIFMSVN